ncbi:hypothetical protein WJT74_00360 [Sphingomicrobium sp. XHP0239]|uniref:hypothetical protein n=1 Tax=Sphingomicrobium maritimum TaxID=3133972 RepID=UPI0031CC8C7B
MRWRAVLLMVALAGCRQEPTFDERFDDTKNEIFERAEELDESIEQERVPPPEEPVEPEEPDPPR